MHLLLHRCPQRRLRRELGLFMPKARGESCGKMRSHSSLEDTQAVGGFCALLIYQVSADTLISSGIRDRRWGSQRTTSYRLQPLLPETLRCADGNHAHSFEAAVPTFPNPAPQSEWTKMRGRIVSAPYQRPHL